MLTLHYKDVNSRHMTNALIKIGRYDKFAPKTAMAIAVLCEEIDKANEKVNNEFVALTDEHSLKDKDGNHIPKRNANDDPIPNTFTPKDPQAWEKLMDEFNEKTFKINADPIQMKDLNGVGLTPFEIKQLKPVITELSLA